MSVDVFNKQGKHMIRKLSKIFIGLAIVVGAVSAGLLLTHTYFNDYFFDSITGMQHPASKFLSPDARDLTILVAADSGSNNYVLENVIDDARRIEPKYDFMMHLGDMAITGSITGYYWMLEEIRPRLGDIPLFTVPGNHDVTQHIGYARHEHYNKALYSTVMGLPYYWFGYGNTLFIVLDTSTLDVDDEQFVWLDQTLTKIRPMFRHCVIFNHMPPVNVRPDFIKGHTMAPAMVEKLATVIQKHHTKIDAMLCGHVHFTSQTKWAGIPLYTVTASGQGVRDKDNENYGYAVLKISKSGAVTVEPHYIAHNGALREYFEEWWARDLLSVKAQELLSTLLQVFGVCLVLGIGLRLYDKYKK